MYKLNPEYAKIISPIIVCVDGVEKCFENGGELAEYRFEKNYIVHSIKAVENSIVLTLSENNQSMSSNWISEEAISFF